VGPDFASVASQTPLFPIHFLFLLAGSSPSHAPPLHGRALLRKATRHRKVKMDVSITIPAYFRIALERGFFEKAKNPRSKDNFCGTTQKPLGGWIRNIMSGRKSVSSFPRRQPKVQKLVFSQQVFFQNRTSYGCSF
jgi:hypothetical protein